jgi:AcrR family transcriptional regulator
VVEAALDLIDDRGLEGLNFRDLAEALGVGTMTSYGYFADKEDLLNAMAAHALASLAVDGGSGATWDQQLETAMLGIHDSLEAHPGVIDLLLAKPDVERIEEFNAGIVTMLTGAGFDKEQARKIIRSLSSYVVGYHAIVRRRRNPRGIPPGSFEYGFNQLMEAVRQEGP